MKKWQISLLTLLLLLCGCDGATGQTAGESTAASHPGQTTQPVAPGGTGSLYMPDSALEARTDGSVKVYALEDGICDGMLPMGQDLLLYRGEKLTLLKGQELTFAVTAQMTGRERLAVQVGTGGVSYLDERAGAVVFLNGSLRETSRLQMPEDMLGTACLSPDWTTVYYSTRTEIRGLDLNTGVSRLVREQGAVWQSVDAVLMDGSVLCCVSESAQGSRKTSLISAETGQTLWEGSEMDEIATAGGNWFFALDQGSVTEYLFGAGEDSFRNLWPEGTLQSVTFLPEQSAAVSVSGEKESCRLDYYDLTTGRRTASVFLPEIRNVRNVCAAADGGGIWFLAEDAQVEWICRWELEMSAIDDEKDYTQPHYTRDTPDEEGLEVCRSIARMLGEKYGVQILIGPEAEKRMPPDYRFDQEYLVQAYETWLPVLDRALSQFPDGFFRTAAERSEEGVLRICLVRGISGDPAAGTLPEVGCVQYWLDGDAYLALSMGQELERNVYHAMSHLIETRVLSVCTAYYDWDTLNPQGFAYDNDYIANQDRQDDRYLEEADRAFIDMFSMSYAREDRARILEYACLPGNEAYFRSDIMQKKLRMLCDGIRQAFGLEQEGTLLWEQYLRAGEQQPAGTAQSVSA